MADKFTLTWVKIDKDHLPPFEHEVIIFRKYTTGGRKGEEKKEHTDKTIGYLSEISETIASFQATFRIRNYSGDSEKIDDATHFAEILPDPK